MRTLAALALSVSLAGAADWETNNKAGLAAVERHDFAAAADTFEKNWSQAESPHERAISAANAGGVLHRAGRQQEAKQWLERSWQTQKSAVTSADLALVYRFLGYYTQAEQVLREGLLLPDSVDETRAAVMNSLADILREEGRGRESKELFEQTLQLNGISWRSRFESEAGLGDLNRDPDMWDRALALSREHHDISYEGVALRGEGQAWLARASMARAEPLLRQSLALFEQMSEPESHQTGTTLSCLAQLYLADGKPALAQEALLRALEIDERLLGDRHPQVATLLEMLADAASQLDSQDLSRTYLDRAENIMRARFGDASTVVASLLANRGSIEQREGHYGEACAAYEKALPLVSSAAPDLQDFKAELIERYAQALKAAHRGKEARVLLAEVKAFHGK